VVFAVLHVEPVIFKKNAKKNHRQSWFGQHCAELVYSAQISPGLWENPP
jgi:hypothetical protein